MPVVATSPEAKLLDELERIIAGSSTFQTWTGAVDAAAALAFIFGEGFTADDDLSNNRPFALISLNRIASRNTAAISFEHTAQLSMVLDSTFGDGLTTPEDVARDFLNKAGGVRADILALAGTSYGGATSYLMIQSCELVTPPVLVPIDRQNPGAADGNYVWCQYDITAGWSGGA